MTPNGESCMCAHAFVQTVPSNRLPGTLLSVFIALMYFWVLLVLLCSHTLNADPQQAGQQQRDAKYHVLDEPGTACDCSTQEHDGRGGYCREWDEDCRNSTFTRNPSEGGWCYVNKSCPGAIPSHFTNSSLYWSCSPCFPASPSPVPSVAPSPQTPLPAKGTEASPSSRPSPVCACNGRSVSSHGAECGEWDDDCKGSGGWCYVDEGACPSTMKSHLDPALGLWWSCNPCGASPSPVPSLAPLPQPSTHVLPPEPALTPEPGSPSPSPVTPPLPSPECGGCFGTSFVTLMVGVLLGVLGSHLVRRFICKSPRQTAASSYELNI